MRWSRWQSGRPRPAGAADVERLQQDLHAARSALARCNEHRRALREQKDRHKAHSRELAAQVANLRAEQREHR